MLAPTAEHGTYAGYNAHRRRGETPCDACRAAQTDYCRDYRHRTGRSKPWAEYLAEVRGRRVHGTSAMYVRGECRCDVCKAWNRGYTAGYRTGRGERP